MFGLSNIWVIGAVVVLLLGGVAWHEKKVSGLKDEVLSQERARVSAATEELKRTEAIRQADIAAQSEREAEEQEKEMAAKDRDIEATNLRIEELEKGSKCSISRATVRELNRAR